jgi:hypothetical protein
MRLGARVGELRRIKVIPLHGADRTRHIAITGVRNACQDGGDLLEERIPVPHRQRAGCGEDRGDLTVGQSERRHAARIRGGCQHMVRRARISSCREPAGKDFYK